MPALAHKNPIELLRRFRDEFLTKTAITNFDRLSKTRAHSDAVTDGFLTLREEAIRVTRSQDPLFAKGRDLDVLGERLGVLRLKATFAQSQSSERCFAFYVSSGTFGNINSNNPISIPAGEIVFTDPNQNELGAYVQYALTESIVLPVDTAIAYISVKATVIGAGSNIGSKVIRNHNFTSYTDSAARSLKIINFYPVLNGSNDEPDDIYRFRIVNFYTSLLQVNEQKIRLLGLEVPGVLNVRVEPAYYGIGTAGALVLGAENQSNPSLVAAVQSKIGQWQMPGAVIIATAATEVFFDFSIRVRPHKTLTTNETARVRAELNKAFLAYFKTISLGGTIDLGLILKYIQKNIQQFAAVNLKDREQTLRKVFVRKGYSGSTTDERSKVVGTTYTLDSNEFPRLGTFEVEIA
jgi:uncharacterized phage protein gp47/JayE